MKLSSRSTSSGPGSRGGHYHEPAFRLWYHRTWRALHPEYRERERLRRYRARHGSESQAAPAGPVPGAVPCACYCACGEIVTRVVCGFCAKEMHAT